MTTPLGQDELFELMGMACSPKPDPCGMRVLTALEGQGDSRCRRSDIARSRSLASYGMRMPCLRRARQLARRAKAWRSANRRFTIGVFFLAAPVGFVHLDRSSQTIPPRPHHCPTKFVQPSPSRYITAQTQFLLQAHRTCTILLAGYVPSRSKPHTQRLAGVLKDCARRDRSLIAACPANQPSPSCRPIPWSLTTWANKAGRPTQADQVIPTRFLGRKSFFQFHHCSRVIFHTRLYYM